MSVPNSSPLKPSGGNPIACASTSGSTASETAKLIQTIVSKQLLHFPALLAQHLDVLLEPRDHLLEVLFTTVSQGARGLLEAVS